MILTPGQIAAIRQDYIDGYGPYQSCRRQGLTQGLTYQRVRTQYDKFERAHLVRHRPFKPSHGQVVTRYLGSPWLGKAITAPPVPIGPDWIGSAA